MPYHLNEGTLSVAPSQDRSIHMLTLERPQGPPVNLILTRDVLEAGESLEDCVTRQLRMLARQTQGFKEHVRHAQLIGQAALPAILLETQFKQSGQNIYQCQAVAQLDDKRLLIFILNSPVPLDGTLRAQWQEILDGFVPVAVPAASDPAQS